MTKLDTGIQIKFIPDEGFIMVEVKKALSDGRRLFAFRTSQKTIRLTITVN